MLTSPKDLRTGTPLWSLASAKRISATPLTRTMTTDVVIIGAGVSGAMVAEELTHAGLSVIMLDRRGPIQGSTAASTALLIHEIDTPLTELAQKIGQARAVQAWRRSKLGLESLISRIYALNIDCALERAPSLLLSGDKLNAHGLKSETTARNAAALPAQYLTAAQVERRFGIGNRTALLSQQCAMVDPVRMTSGFLRAALDRGLQIFTPVEATNLRKNGKKWTIQTSTGFDVHAQHVIYASGYEIPKAVHTRRHKIMSTWVMATRPQPRKIWPERCVIWEASETYLYIRTTPDGRVICGGEDEDFSDALRRDDLIAHKTAMLEKKLARLFPQLDCRATHAWAGSFGASTTGLPSIGQIPRMKNVYAIMAYGGNGINFSRIAAEIITSAITGQRDPDADVFSFT